MYGEVRGDEWEAAGGGLGGTSAAEEAKRVVGKARLCSSVVCGARDGAEEDGELA